MTTDERLDPHCDMLIKGLCRAAQDLPNWMA